MTTKTVVPIRDVLAGSFGFDPDESASHFLVHIPAGSSLAVEISEHFSWDER